MAEIPIIDFTKCGLTNDSNVSDEEIAITGNLIVEALSGIGFAYLKNVGINQTLINNAFRVYAEVFRASLDEKNKYAITNNYHGYLGKNTENLNPNITDRKEAFNVRGAAISGDPEFPWPDNLSPEFSTVITELMNQCEALSHRILKAIAVGLQLNDSEYFVNSHSNLHDKSTPTTLRGSYYVPIPDAEPGTIRLGSHSDYGTVTLLFQDDVGGLQVQNTKGEFVDATPIDNTVVINIGDCLQFWTKYKLKATKHQVVVPNERNRRLQTRQSLAYFVNGNDGTVIDELEVESNFGKLVKKENRADEDKVTIQKYIAMRMTDATSY